MPMSRSLSTNTGVWNRSAMSNAFDRQLERFARIGRIETDVPRVAVRRVGGHHQVALLRARRHAGGRARALHVEDHRRHLGVVGQADELVHQRDAGTRGGCERAGTGPAGADHHADGGELVLRLEDRVAVLLASRDPGGTSGRSRGRHPSTRSTA